MGLRFRKSIKIAKGVRLNVGKKSVGISVGGKGARFSVNSRGRKSATVGIPGTGLSYTANLSNKKRRKKSSSRKRKIAATRSSANSSAEVSSAASQPYKAKPAPSEPWYRAFIVFYVVAAIFVYSGLHGLFAGLTVVGSIITLLIGLISLFYGIKGHRISRNTPKEDDQIKNKPAVPIEQIQAVLLPNAQKTASWKQLVQAAQVCAPNWWKIEWESHQLTETTINPEVFFSRYDLMIDQLKSLTIAENVIEMPSSPSSILESAKLNRDSATIAFIDRAYGQMSEKTETLKTERGKRNRKIKFYQSILEYENKYSIEVQNYILTKMESDEIALEECKQESSAPQNSSQIAKDVPSDEMPDDVLVAEISCVEPPKRLGTGWSCRIAGVILILLSLAIMITSPFGVLGVLLGIAAILYSGKQLGDDIILAPDENALTEGENVNE